MIEPEEGSWGFLSHVSQSSWSEVWATWGPTCYDQHLNGEQLRGNESLNCGIRTNSRQLVSELLVSELPDVGNLMRLVSEVFGA